MQIPDAESYSARWFSPAAMKTRCWRSPRAPSMSQPTSGPPRNDSTLAQMLTKGMLKNADGTPMKKEDFRIVHKSAPILNGPYAVLTDMPADLKVAIEKAFFEAPGQGQGRLRQAVRRTEEGFQPGDHQGLGRHGRTDQVRRQPSQEEGLLIAAKGWTPCVRPFLIEYLVW